MSINGIAGGLAQEISGLGPALSRMGSALEAISSVGLDAGAADSAAPNISRAVGSIEEWLGSGATRVESETSDLILRSADGTKQIRFDLTNPHGLDPHINIETWQPRNLFPGDNRFIPVDNIHIFPKSPN